MFTGDTLYTNVYYSPESCQHDRSFYKINYYQNYICTSGVYNTIEKARYFLLQKDTQTIKTVIIIEKQFCFEYLNNILNRNLFHIYPGDVPFSGHWQYIKPLLDLLF